MTRPTSIVRFVALVAFGAAVLATCFTAAIAAPITGGRGPGGVESVVSSDLQGWWQADAITGATDGGNLTTWVNSGSGSNAVANAGEEPVYRTGISGFNSLPVVEFVPSTTDRMLVASFASGGDSTLIAAVQSTGTANGQVFNPYGSLSVGGNVIIERSSAGVLTGRTFNSAGTANTGQVDYPSLVNGTTLVASYTFQNNTPSTGAELYVDGTSVGTATTNSVANATSTASLGNNPASNANPWGGYIAEVVFMNRLVNSAERVLIENYLSSKYDRSISGDHYAGDTTGNGDYDQDVFGIGRVDASNQLTNTGAAGLGIEANASSLGDGEWVLAGHNVATNSIVSAVGGNIAAGDRWDRAWFIDVTGDVNATLAFDFSDGGLGAPLVTDEFRLLYKSQEGFTWQALNTPLLVSGDLVTFNLVGLQDGYFTLGINIASVPEPSTLALVALGAAVACFPRRRRRG